MTGPNARSPHKRPDGVDAQGEARLEPTRVPVDVVAFDPVVHAPARLKILMLLAALGSAAFNTLAREAELTAGNLANHLKTLEKAGYVDSRKRFVELKPRMRYSLTDEGSAALRAYCAALENALHGLQGLVGDDARDKPDSPGGNDDDQANRRP